ncbi:MAG: YhdP family protein [Candidatus Competibacter sp.]|nr:YhdP family protein [Candidatus Competibacter sp.]
MSPHPLTPDPSPSEGEESERLPGRGFWEVLRRPTSRVRRTLRWTRRLVVALLLPFVLLAAFGQWWLLPRLNDYRDELAGALRDYLRLPARIEAVTGVRDGWRLGLRLRGVGLYDPANGAVLASFTQAAATLSLWHSLWEWRPVFSHIRLEGANLSLEQGPDGMPRLLADIGTVDTAPLLTDGLRWLFGLRRLEIVGEQLTVRRPDGGTLRFLHPYLQLQETGRGQRLEFTAELPAGLGDRLQFALERQHPDGTDPEQGQGTFQIRADRLNLAGWPLSPTFAAGQATLELHGEWRDWQPSRLEGHLRLREATPDRESRSALPGPWLARLPEDELSLNWQRRENGWQLLGQARFGPGRGQVVARPTFELSRTGERWQGRIRELDARDLLAWVAPWLDEAARRWLVPLDPRGALPEITFWAEPAAGVYSATVQLRGVACRPVRGLPGFDNLTGILEFAPDRGRLELDSREVQVDTDGLLRAPVALDKLTGVVNWRRDAGVLRLDSDGIELANADFGGRFQGGVTVPDKGEPVLDVQGHYHDVRGDRAARYLPVTVIPPQGVAWLDRALVAGRVVAGELVFRGPPVDFPFDRGEGFFETRFQVEDGVLDYAPGWPRLDRLRATVTFRNRGLRVEAESGRLVDAEMQGATAWIDDLENPVVQVRGRAKGSSAGMWRALRDSPMGRELGDDLPELRFTGANTLDLELTIPTDARPNRARGRVGLLDGGLNLANWNVELGRLRGEVRFTEAGLEARDVRALLRGEPVRLELDLAGREGRRELRARLRGRFGLRALAGEAAAVLEPYASGKSTWEAMLAVPVGHRERRNESPPFSLDLSSDLRGIAVRLPAPLGKTASEARPLRIELRPRARDALDLTLEYDAGLRAALELGGIPNDLRIERGELRLNAGMARLPDAPGLAVIADLPRWELELPAATPESSDFPAVSTGSRSNPVVPAPISATGLARVLRGLDARIGELIVAGQSFPGMTVHATREQDGMVVDLESETLAGRVMVPDQPAPEQPIHAALRRLYLGRAAAGASDRAGRTGPDPSRLPPLVLTAADLRLDGAALGQLRLVATPRTGGIRLTEIDLNSEQQHISASGEWWRTLTGQASRLRATLRSRALGETLSAFGYAGTGIARGETQAELEVEWAAALPDFTLDRMEGVLKFQVGSGQLLDIDPGMGRMVGIFNVQNLMRRLSFDFSDLFQPGMGFDRMTGEFTFGKGDAFTDNFLIEAPAAQILIQGRTGLKARDYDQRITVTPRLGGTLPVAGALAGGPAVGAAIFLAEQLLRKGIEHATRYRYTLKGSWDEPVLESPPEPPPTTPTKAFAGEN